MQLINKQPASLGPWVLPLHLDVAVQVYWSWNAPSDLIPRLLIVRQSAPVQQRRASGAWGQMLLNFEHRRWESDATLLFITYFR